VSRSARGRSARARHSARFPRLVFPCKSKAARVLRSTRQSALPSFVLFSPDWPAARAPASPTRGTGYHRVSLVLFLAKGAGQDSCPSSTYQFLL
jgi:hypothetical protein